MAGETGSDDLRKELVAHVRKEIGAIAKPRQVMVVPEVSRISVLMNGRCQGSKVSIPAGGQTPSTAGDRGPIGYIACLKNDQNQAAILRLMNELQDVADGEPVWYLVPDGVVQYINKYALYSRADDMEPSST